MPLCCFIVPSQRGKNSLSWTFKLNVPSWWNDLPNSIPAAESLAIFKNRLKTEITWPFDGDVRVVFHSAHTVKYFIILSVNFEPLCIGPIMSASTVKGDWKREIGQSPIKKRFKDPTISREDLDGAIANGIKLALKEQQSTLDSVVASTVRDAVDSVLTPALHERRADIQVTNNSVKELRAELEALASAAKQTRDRVDSVKAAAREDRRTVTDLRNQLERLTEKMTDIEDRSRRYDCTYDWWGCQRGRRAPMQLASSELIFPSGSLPWKTVASRRKEKLQSAAYSHLPCTKMAWQIGDPERCSAGLSGEMHAGQCHTTIFPDFSPATAARRKSIIPVLKKMTSLGLQPFLTYPAVIKLRHKGEQRSFDSLQKAEDFISSLSQKKTYTVAPQGNGRTAATIYLFGPAGGAWWPGWRRFLLPGRRWWQSGRGYLLNLFFFFFLSPPGMLFLFVQRNCLFTGETNSPLFFWRGLVESGLDCSGLFLAMWAFWEARLVDRSRIINIFCCSIRPTFSVMCGLSCLLFIVVLVPVSVLFLFFTTDIHTFIYFTLFLKGFFI